MIHSFKRLLSESNKSDFKELKFPIADIVTSHCEIYIYIYVSLYAIDYEIYSILRLDKNFCQLL